MLVYISSRHWGVVGWVSLNQLWEDVTSGNLSYHMWRECWLEVEEHSDGGDLLQPFTAHLFTVLLILSVIVETQVQCAHKLLRQCTQRPHQGLAEYDIPPQLEFCVCDRRVQKNSWYLYKYCVYTCTHCSRKIWWWWFTFRIYGSEFMYQRALLNVFFNSFFFCVCVCVLTAVL